MKAKISILFYAKRAKTTTEGLLPIYLRVTIEGKRIEITTKRYVEASKWCPKSGKLKGGSEDSRTVNKHLDQLKQDIYDYENDLRGENKEVNYDNLKNKVLGTEVKARMLVPIFQKHNDDIKALLGAIEKYRKEFDIYRRNLNKSADSLKPIEFLNKNLSDQLLDSYETKLFIESLENSLKEIQSNLSKAVAEPLKVAGDETELKEELKKIDTS